jgi:hypothetical protein
VPSAETDEFTSLTPELEPIRWLLEDEDAPAYLESIPDPVKRKVSSNIREQAVSLREMTGWNSDTLIKRIGCPAKQVKDFKDMAPDRLRMCSGYLTLLTELTELVDLDVDARRVVVRYRHFYDKVEHRIDLLVKAFNSDSEAYELVALGEVGRGFHAALTAVDPSYGYQGEDPFSGVPGSHISAHRLRKYCNEEREALGENVFERIRTHIEGGGDEQPCAGCAEALEVCLHERDELPAAKSSAD